MYWANFLHFYQPPTQSKHWIDKITEECYRRLIFGFLENRDLKATLNVNALLFEFWEEYGHQDVIEGLKKLLSRGQVELTGTAKYHPLLPKIPETEMQRQIVLNDLTSVRVLGDLYQPVGFFPPEMGYNREVAQVAADLGYQWIIAEELSLNHEFGTVDYSKVYEVEDIEVKGRGGACPAFTKRPEFQDLDSKIRNQKLKLRGRSPLRVFFREREISYQILSGQLATPGLLKKALGNRLKKENHYLLTAMDGETFGHHRPGMDKLLFDLLKTEGLETVLVSELPDLIKGREVVKTKPATWALMRHDIEKNTPLARWEDPENKIHQLQWDLTNLAIDTVRNSKYRVLSTKYQIPSSKEFGACGLGFGISGHGRGELTAEQEQWLEARELLDKAIHSDQYWWASAKPWWSLEMIERGAKELLEAVKAVPDAPEAKKEKAQALYYEIITTGFDWQRSGKVEKISKREDEAIRMRTDEGVPELPAEEIDKMIAPIQKEMLEAARKKEYERAAQLRDRIQELEKYKDETGD